MNTQLQLATTFTDVADLDLRNQNRIAIIARAVEAAKLGTIKTRTTKVWRTMPDSHYNMTGTGTGEEPHQCYSRAEANGM